MNSKIELTKELYEFIENKCELFNKATDEHYDVEVDDVLYSYLYSSENEFYISNDWNEGCNNDEWWDYENNQHSTTKFLKEICFELDNLIIK